MSLRALSVLVLALALVPATVLGGPFSQDSSQYSPFCVTQVGWCYTDGSNGRALCSCTFKEKRGDRVVEMTERGETVTRSEGRTYLLGGRVRIRDLNPPGTQPPPGILEAPKTQKPSQASLDTPERREYAEKERFSYCSYYMANANTTAALPLLSNTFWIEQDKGVRLEADAKKKGFVVHPGQESYDIETPFGDPKHPVLSTLMAGVQINSKGGEPRTFEVVERQIVNPTGEGGQPTAVRLYRHEFSFVGGKCVPMKVTRVDSEREVEVFNLEKCVRNPEMHCFRTKPFDQILGDRKVMEALLTSGAKGSTIPARANQ